MSNRVPIRDTARARRLRAEATKAERHLWALISRYRPKFTRQFPIGAYVVDFACRQLKLIVEVDGGQHAESSRDQKRDDYLRQEGWRVLRLWNTDVLNNPEGSVQAIMDAAAECLGGTHPQPLPFREGRVRRHRFD